MSGIIVNDDSVRGLTGLSNMGNTCYINSVIQCLSNNIRMTKTFLEYEKKLKETKTGKKYEDFLSCYIILIREIWRTNSILKPTSFKKALNFNHPKYDNKYQHDAHEFLLDVLDMLNESTNVKYAEVLSDYSSSHYIKSRKSWKSTFGGKKSFITEEFFGQFLTKFRCNTCRQKFYKYEPFCCIYLSIPNLTQCFTTQSLIEEYFKPSYNNVICQNECNESIEDKEDYTNPEHKISTNLLTLPETLTLVIKRYNNENKKMKNEITIDQMISLDKFSQITGDESVYYKFKSAIFHTGDTTDSGHYFSVIKRKTGYKIFDDTKIFGVEDVNSIDKTTSYILFYEKISLKK